MTEWLETYRGVVNPWECDVVQHFTIAYYFDRFADATRNFIDLIAEGDSLDAGVRNGPSRGHATFQHELRAGAGFHILTAVTGIDASALQLGHRVVELDDRQDGGLAQRDACIVEDFTVPRRAGSWLRSLFHGRAPKHPTVPRQGRLTGR